MISTNNVKVKPGGGPEKLRSVSTNEVKSKSSPFNFDPNRYKDVKKVKRGKIEGHLFTTDLRAIKERKEKKVEQAKAMAKKGR